MTDEVKEIVSEKTDEVKEIVSEKTIEEHHRDAAIEIRNSAEAVINSGVAGAAMDQARREYLLADALAHLYVQYVNSIKPGVKEPTTPKTSPTK